MKYDFILIALYLLVLAVIAIELFDMVAITVIFVLIILIVILQKVGIHDTLESFRSNTDTKLDEMTRKIDSISRKADDIKEDVSKQVSFVDNKNEDSLYIGGVKFTSRVLRVN